MPAEQSPGAAALPARCHQPQAQGSSAPSARVLRLRTAEVGLWRWSSPSRCPSCAGGMEGSTSADLPGYLRVPSSADGSRRGHLRSPGEEARGVSSGGLLFAQMRQVPSHLAACRPGTHRTTQRQHLWGGPGQARESRVHQSTGSASTNNPGSQLGAASACADVQQQLFSITKSSRIYQKTQGREGKESWPAEGPQQRAHASLVASWAGSDQRITSLPFSTGMTLPHVSLQPSLCGSPAPMEILVFCRKTPPRRASLL